MLQGKFTATLVAKRSRVKKFDKTLEQKAKGIKPTRLNPSYFIGTPDRIRTCDIRLRRQFGALFSRLSMSNEE